MAFGLTKSRLSPIAIDFGADSLKLLQIYPGEPPSIVAAAAMEVPEHARTDPAARAAFFLDALRMALKQAPFKGKRAVCSIPAYQTLMQHFQIARGENEDIESQVAIHLRQRLNVNPSRMVIRTFPVGQIVRDGVSKQEVICVAAGKEAVMRHVETAHRCKLDVVGMHCEPLAMIKAFGHLHRRADDVNRTTCYIDIGAATTKMCIAHGMEIVFARTIHAAGDHLTRRLAAAQEISFAEARQRRISSQDAAATPVNAPTADPDAQNGGKDRRGKGAGGPIGLAAIEAQISAEMQHEAAVATAEPDVEPAVLGRVTHDDAADDPLECLIEELRGGVRYHHGMFPERPIEKLVFLGGESRHITACQRIARALRIGAQLGDPLARATGGADAGKTIGVDLTSPQPGWAVPYGLCLCESNVR